MVRTMYDIKLQLNLLNKPTGTWNAVEISKYFGISYGSAYKIYKKILAKERSVPHFMQRLRKEVSISGVLGDFSLTRTGEIRRIKMTLENE